MIENPKIGQRVRIKAPHVPFHRELGEITALLPTTALEVRLDRMPVDMNGRVVQVGRDQVEAV